MRPLLPLLVVLALAGGGFSLAGEIPVFTPEVVYRTRDAIATTTSTEIVTWAGDKIVKNTSWGRYVRWGGSVLLGSALIYAALDWFYNYLNRETGTTLDTWYFWRDVPWGAWDIAILSKRCSYVGSGKYTWEYSYYYIGNGVSANLYPYSSGIPSCGDPPDALAMQILDSRHPRPNNFDWYPGSGKKLLTQTGSTFVSNPLYFRGNPNRPSLPDWLQSHPDAINAVRDLTKNYVENNPPGSPSSPWPGVQLIPVPNPNQWTDNPFTRPDIDTDGDGWPDSVEWMEANRSGQDWPTLINNPSAHPDPSADPDKDGFTNLEELTAGTDPYSPASHPVRPSPVNTSADSDRDGWPDAVEIAAGSDPSNASSTPSPLSSPNPSIDADGDGWPDSVEITAGSNPNDASSVPTPRAPASPDSDGDGWPDSTEISAGTDPHDPNSHPEGTPPPPSKEDEPQWPGGPPPGTLKPVELPEVSAERKELPKLEEQESIWNSFQEQVTERVRQRVQEINGKLSRKFPFSIIQTIGRLSFQSGTASCAIEFPVGDLHAQFNICETPFWQYGATFRPILAMLLWIVVGLLMIRRGLDIPA